MSKHKEYVQASDLPLINKALSEGKDVRVQRTKNGYRIICETVQVLKRTGDKNIDNDCAK